MKKNIATLFPILVILITSCKNEIPFNIKENPPKLVMNAFINADSLTNYLYLNLTGHGRPAHVKGASLEVRVNGKIRESLRPMTKDETSNSPQCIFKLSGKFLPGDLIRIDAQTDDGIHHAWAEVTVPQRMPEIQQIETQNTPLRQYGSTRHYLRYKITLNDIRNEKNFYRLIVDKQTKWISWFHDRDQDEGNDENKQNKKMVTDIYHDCNYIFREDVVLTDGRPQSDAEEENGMFDYASNVYGVFDDSRFENSTYTMTVYNDPSYKEYNGIHSIHRCTVDVYIRLLSITETEYYYLKALNVVDSDVFDEILNESINYPSNVHGGTGIVGVSTETSKMIRLIDKEYNM